MTLEQSLEQATEHHRAGRLREAETLYRQILSHQPDHPDALHLLGVLADQTGRSADGADLIRRAIALRPDAAIYYTNLGIVLSGIGQQAEALAAQRHAVALDPGSIDAHHNLGRSLMETLRPAEAAGEFRAALALDPDNADVLANLANALRQIGQIDEAIAHARRALARRPDLVAAYNNLGAALHQKGEYDQAIEAYRKAIALQPNAADAHHNLGVAMYRTGRLDDAIESLSRAIALQPGRAQTHHQLSIALRERGRLDEAAAAAQQAIALQPDHSDAHNNLGIIYSEKGLIDNAIAAYRQAIALSPGFGGAHNNLGNALKDTGQIEEAIACYRRAAELDPQSRVVGNLLYSLHFHPGYNTRQIAQEHIAWNAAYARPLAAQIKVHENDRTPSRRLRIGYVSMDLREHPVGRFLLPLLANHDRAGFEVFCYSDLARPDGLSERIKQASDVWRGTIGLSDEALARLVREDRIDILVDLAMHMDGTRMLAFARKPAPVQVTYLAYCSTTGLETIDYRLTDPYLDPLGIDESIYSEKSIRLPQTYWCYESPAKAPSVAPLPASIKGHVTFGSLNNFGKVTQDALCLWAELLRQVPDSELIFHAAEGSHRQRVRDQFAAVGINPDRIRFVGRIPLDDYFHQYAGIDIALDPFPYPGGTTTCDALWMGVPVVTLAGPFAASRGGVSILSNAGLSELIAGTTQQYAQIAVALARDFQRLTELRSSLRARMTQSPLMNARQFARDIEGAYHTMWREWCA